MGKGRIGRVIGPGGGRIINVSSNVTTMALPTLSVYSATKGAVDVLTQVWAAELGPRGITVNAINPGLTETDLNAGMDDQQKDRMIRMTTLGRLGTAEDIADAAAFLATDDARWVTGQCLAASGDLRG